MSLPMPWVDKIFAKLTLAYGRQFTERWAELPAELVKADWAHELAGFERNPEAIAYGLQHLPPDRPPTVMQFREICRRAPLPIAPRLESPPANPERVRAELAKLREKLGMRPPKPAFAEKQTKGERGN